MWCSVFVFEEDCWHFWFYNWIWTYLLCSTFFFNFILCLILDILMMQKTTKKTWRVAVEAKMIVVVVVIISRRGCCLSYSNGKHFRFDFVLWFFNFQHFFLFFFSLSIFGVIRWAWLVNVSNVPIKCWTVCICIFILNCQQLDTEACLHSDCRFILL